MEIAAFWDVTLSCMVDALNIKAGSSSGTLVMIY
jgi:hypothetical protein